ncbi:MAG: hypothetical protein CME65_05890 [Halobacteriovoraceae bacterium]|nr:hypothetical protein [Halobacteriovoraceae bacterium]|tara:strand:+ start:8761 stop:10122 length:1362 start_codon:yes stop_codon:yes gene_type:complete
MLKASYDHNIVGQNYISLIQGILSLRQNKKTLLINDKNYRFANQWYKNIGYAERAVLNKLGEQLEIDCLGEIDSNLQPQNTLLSLNQKLLEMGDSPFTNIKEIARKIPECFSSESRRKMLEVETSTFDAKFFEMLDLLADRTLSSKTIKLKDFFSEIAFEEFRVFLQEFMSFVHSDILIAKQLHFVNQVLFQTIFSSGFSQLESTYLFISLISPRYKVDEDSLNQELLYEYRLLGGDTKTAGIVDWGIRGNQLEFVQLDSVDGNVHVEQTYFFGQDNFRLPFETLLNPVVFKSINIECLIEHEFIDFFRGKRIVFAPQNRMGSDFPFWELEVDEAGKLQGLYSYSDFQGTKPSFYYPSAIDDVYQSLKTILPGLKRSDWVSRAKLSEGSDIWFKYKPQIKLKLSPDSKTYQEELVTMRLKDKSKVQLLGLNHCGPSRARSLGLFSYLLDIFAR